MATYNPLNEFNTFSYHHFLLVVDSTAAADRLQDNAQFFRLVNEEETMQGVRVIINPLKSNRYFIENVEWTNWLAQNNEDYGGTVMAGGEFTVVEPNGMSFMNDVMDQLISIGVGTGTCQWVLKTIFVGQTNVGGSGSSSLEYITNITPYLLTMWDLEIEFDEAGGRYGFKFVAAGSGAGLSTAANNMPFGTNPTVNLGSSDSTGAVTLEQALRKLESHANETVQQRYKEAEAAREKMSESPPPQEVVKFVIEIPESLKQPHYIVASPGRAGAGPDGSSPILAMDPGATMTDAIMEVLKMCERLMADSVKPGQRMEHFIVSAEVLDAPGSNPRKTYVFHIKERPIEPVKDPAAKDGGTGTGELPEADRRAIENGQMLEFDYLYTGKNIDVLGFDMKMAAGLAFLESIISISGQKTDRADTPKAESAVSASNSTEPGTGAPLPHKAPVVAKSTAAGQTNPAAVAAYEQLMQQHSVLSVMTTLKIRGNPILLNDCTPTVNAAGTVDVGTRMGGISAQFTQPIRVRVNVKMPKDGDPHGELQDFWYRGSYLILNVRNIFSGGEFTQELLLVAEMQGTYENSLEKPAPKEEPVFTSIVGETADAEARIRAFMQTIRWCEGTSGPNGYNMMFGGGLFDSMSDHPRVVVSKSGYNSSAAGAYQILTKTWDWISTSPKYSSRLPDFSPVSQDNACWCLLDYRKALPTIRAGNITDALNLCRNEWASLPGSTYGQPTKRQEQVMQVYNKYLEAEMNGQTTLAAPRGMLT